MGQNQSGVAGAAGLKDSDAYIDPPPTSPDEFTFMKVLGQGSFGTVCLAMHKGNSKVYALKVLTKQRVIESREVEHAIAERSILASVNHPFLVRLYGAFQTPTRLVMVLEYVPGGELFFHLKKKGTFDESYVKLVAAQLILALEYLHDMNIVIRDLKPENILLQANGYIKVTDFGLSKQNLSMTLGAKTMAGTSEYFSPEQIQNCGHGKAVDLWALGVIIYELLTGSPPFYSTDKRAMFRRIVGEQPKMPSYFKEDLKDLLKGLLEKKPRNRLGCRKENGGIKELKAHPWFGGINWDKLYRKEYVIPYKPTISDNLDVSNFDKSFTELDFDLSSEPLYKREHTADDDQIFQDFCKAYSTNTENEGNGNDAIDRDHNNMFTQEGQVNIDSGDAHDFAKSLPVDFVNDDDSDMPPLP